LSRAELDARLLRAVEAGDLVEAALALDLGADPDAAGPTGWTALMDAVLRGDRAMVQLLLDRGADAGRRVTLPPAGADAVARIEADLGQPLSAAAREALAQAPAMSAAAECGDAEIARLLAARGAPPEDFDQEMLGAVTGADRIAPVAVTREVFEAGRAARFGRANPEPALEPFWQAQIRSFASGYAGGRQPFLTGEAVHEPPPVWSFDRFGRTVTRLPDGRWLLVAGEHEDHYDPDFCIYNDVTVLDGEGGVEHFLYPAEAFPPTDFHSATLLGDEILLVGSLGYREGRREGETQVMRLSLRDFSIMRVATSGDNPGWIHRHRAALDAGRIVVSGGKVEPGYRDLEGCWALELETWRWERLED
jgi:hypothetical protein